MALVAAYNNIRKNLSPKRKNIRKNRWVSRVLEERMRSFKLKLYHGDWFGYDRGPTIIEVDGQVMIMHRGHVEESQQ
ncbi:hypothetical protein HN51_001677 [Arachis hypogaea]